MDKKYPISIKLNTRSLLKSKKPYKIERMSRAQPSGHQKLRNSGFKTEAGTQKSKLGSYGKTKGFYRMTSPGLNRKPNRQLG